MDLNEVNEAINMSVNSNTSFSCRQKPSHADFQIEISNKVDFLPQPVFLALLQKIPSSVSSIR